MPDIRDDDQVLQVIDELRYRLKPALWAEGHPLASALDNALKQVLSEYATTLNIPRDVES